MPNMYARTALLLLIGFVSPTSILAAETIKKDVIGPWEIEAAFKNDKFDRCAIGRTFDDVQVRFVRDDEGLRLELQSPNWKLERGGSYPVHMKAGPVSWDSEVAAESDSVSIPVTEPKFKTGVRVASVLLVEGAGSTIRVPLDQSTVALNRLEQCFDKNSTAVETNPFVAPKGRP